EFSFEKFSIDYTAQDDGFSNDEIAQFTQLLCSPKKAPPSKYQCHICYRTGHYISDCPMVRSFSEVLLKVNRRKKCYGEFQCQQCKRKWTSQNSVANEAQSCIKCHIPVFPHKQVHEAVYCILVKLLNSDAIALFVTLSEICYEQARTCYLLG
uniref:3CxxC-type domain-containing protein n=1 Tax=Parascaris equorum TaxID=6256 RepID=A0A914RFR4_PAREQ